MSVVERDDTSAPAPLVNGRVRHRPWWPLEFYRSAVGKKWVMAVTGIVLMGYVLLHMIGNLKVYLGPEAINDYGEFLRDFGEPALPRSTVLVDPADRADRRRSSSTSTRPTCSPG